MTPTVNKPFEKFYIFIKHKTHIGTVKGQQYKKLLCPAYKESCYNVN